MTIKLETLLNMNQTLKAIINNEEQVDALLKFKLLGIMKALEGPVANFEIIRNEKILEYGKKAEDGTCQIDKEDTEAVKKFRDSLTEVLNSTVDVTFEKIQAADIFNKGVSAEYLVGLYPIIEGGTI